MFFFLESTELFGKKRLPKNHISMGEDLILKTKYHMRVNDPESTYLQEPMAYGATLQLYINWGLRTIKVPSISPSSFIIEPNMLSFYSATFLSISEYE